MRIEGRIARVTNPGKAKAADTDSGGEEWQLQRLDPDAVFINLDATEGKIVDKGVGAIEPIAGIEKTLGELESTVEYR